jgi:hypothetical protein
VKEPNLLYFLTVLAIVVTRESIRIAVGTGPRLRAAKDQGLWVVLTLVVRILQK